MRATFRWLTSTLFVLLVIQVGLAGIGAFNAIHKADKAAVSKKTIENGFDAHSIVGTLIVVVMLALLLAALRLGPAKLRFAGAIFALGVLQLILGLVSTSVPALGFLHAVNALAIYAAAALLAHRTWTEDRAPASPAAPVPPAAPAA